MKDRSNRMKRLLTVAQIAAAGAALAANTIAVDAAKPRCARPSVQWGIFFEDINLSLDGGVYAELVRNRSFEDNGGKAPDAEKYWTALGGARLAVTDERPHSKLNAHSLKVVAPAGGAVANEGYFGMAVRKGVDYRLSLDVRGDAGRLDVSLESADGKAASTVAAVEVKGDEWTTCRAKLKALREDPKARLVFRSARGGTFCLDCVTLFPSDTYGRSGLFRKDLMEKLAALKPSFVRFPGGCWVEGDTMATAYRWKKTIGSIWERPTQWNIWGYWSTHGVGFHEYLQICEELGSKALFCINVGMSHKETVPMEKMDEFVQDALDCIEYANGPVTSKWGAVRAANGHPAPFNLAYLQIGNENGGPEYEKRYELMAKAVHAKHPEIQLVFDGPWSGDPKKDTWDVNAPKNLRDDHFYRSPEWFFDNDMLYADTKERRLGKRDFGVFVGEYAVVSVGSKHPFGTLRAAIGEAAFMTGLENCSDVVRLAAYAPLFAHVNHMKWVPNLIYIAPGSCFANPSYDVQRLFSENRGREVLATEVTCEPLDRFEGCTFGVGSWMGAAAFKDFKVVDAHGKVLYANDFADAGSVKDWKSAGGGRWTAKGGELVQSETTDVAKAMTLTLDRTWEGDVTCTFKAKRLAGPEGFLAVYSSHGEQSGGCWANFGGWGNLQHGLEGLGAGGRVDGKVESDRWYDVSVSRRGGVITARIGDVELPAGRLQNDKAALLASAVTSPDGKDLIVKVVNFADRPLVAEVSVANAKLADSATLTTYTGPHADASNSLENPEALKPTAGTVAVGDGKVTHEFPAVSLTIIRIPVDKASYPVPRAEINVRDPFVVPDPANRLYRLYMSQPWSGGDGVSLRTSPDLENWSEPKPVLDIPEEVKRTVTAYWAPEMHAYGGKYYVFVTLLRTGKRKGTRIFRSDSPEGPFRPLQLRATTPEDWEALDGTLYVEDGKPYLVFCHEWSQVANGEMCLMPLKDDLSGAAGEPITLFKATDYLRGTGREPAVMTEKDYVTDRVTDGPFLYKSKSGKLFMVWSNLCQGQGYSDILCESESGKVAGPWGKFRILYGKDGGHGMIFRRLDGTLNLTLHRPNGRPDERMHFFGLEDTGDDLVLCTHGRR